MRAFAVLVLTSLLFSGVTAQAQLSNSCKLCRDQKQACMKNYAGPTCASDYEICMKNCEKVKSGIRSQISFASALDWKKRCG